jgi:hypothetical protein
VLPAAISHLNVQKLNFKVWRTSTQKWHDVAAVASYARGRTRGIRRAPFRETFQTTADDYGCEQFTPTGGNSLQTYDSSIYGRSDMWGTGATIGSGIPQFLGNKAIDSVNHNPCGMEFPFVDGGN